jgi:hypothetical protein
MNQDPRLVFARWRKRDPYEAAVDALRRGMLKPCACRAALAVAAAV